MSIGSFIVLLECLDLFDVSRSTFLDLLLHRGERFGKVSGECKDIKKFFRIVIVPPDVEFMGAEEVGFECNWSELCLASISSYLPAACSLNMDCIINNEGILLGIKRFW